MLEIRKIIKLDDDLLLMLLWVISTIIFINISVLSNSIIRIILGIILVLFIPGYLLISILFPKRDDLDDIERLVLSFGLSIAIVPLIGLGLNYTPFGIRLMSILISLSLYSIILIFGTSYRRNIVQNRGEEKFNICLRKVLKNINEEIIKIGNGNKTDKILTILLITSIIIAVGTFIYVITISKQGEKFTEFYILNSSTGKADKYPTELKIGENSRILIGIINHEYSMINYTMTISLDKDRLATKKVTLENNQTWENNITFAPINIGKDERLEFLLFKEDNMTNPYRDLHLWINVSN